MWSWPCLSSAGPGPGLGERVSWEAGQPRPGAELEGFLSPREVAPAVPPHLWFRGQAGEGQGHSRSPGGHTGPERSPAAWQPCPGGLAVFLEPGLLPLSQAPSAGAKWTLADQQAPQATRGWTVDREPRECGPHRNRWPSKWGLERPHASEPGDSGGRGQGQGQTATRHGTRPPELEATPHPHHADTSRTWGDGAPAARQQASRGGSRLEGTTPAPPWTQVYMLLWDRRNQSPGGHLGKNLRLLSVQV